MSDLLRDDSGAPARDPGVIRALRAIHPDLRVAWKRFRFNVETGRYLIAERGPETGQPIPWPNGGGRWCVFVKNDKGLHFIFAHMTHPDGDFMPLDDRLCERLLMDVARRLSPEEIVSLREDAEIRKRDKLRKLMDEIYWENINRNMGKAKEAMEIDPNTIRWHCLSCGNDAPPEVTVAMGVPQPRCARCGSTKMTDMPVRDAKIFSYPGQENRATRIATVEKSAQEDGWDLVDVTKESERARNEIR